MESDGSGKMDGMKTGLLVREWRWRRMELVPEIEGGGKKSLSEERNVLSGMGI